MVFRRFVVFLGLSYLEFFIYLYFLWFLFFFPSPMFLEVFWLFP